MTLIVTLRHKETGKITSVPRPCEEFGCRTCGPVEARRHWQRVQEHLASLDHVFFTRWEGDTTTRKRINQRASRAKASLFTVRFSDGSCLTVSDKPLGGRLPPSQSVLISRPRALFILRTKAFEDPTNIRGISGSKRCPMPNGRPPNEDSPWKLLVVFSKRRWEEIMNGAEALIRARGKNMVDLSDDEIREILAVAAALSPFPEEHQDIPKW